MIDLHVHLLHGIDDGPNSIDSSIEMARGLAADGVRVAAATPHLRLDHPMVKPAELAGRREELATALRRNEIDLEVVAGGEVDISWALRASDEELGLVSYGQLKRCLLVETPYGPLPHHFEHLLFDLELRGFRLLLAHPERNVTFQDDPSRLDSLATRGITPQITASSLVPRRRSRSHRLAVHLLRSGSASIIASDAHAPYGRHARVPLSEGLRWASRIAPERTKWMVVDAPEAILAGRQPPDAPKVERGLLNRLRRPWRM